MLYKVLVAILFSVLMVNGNPLNSEESSESSESSESRPCCFPEQYNGIIYGFLHVNAGGNMSTFKQKAVVHQDYLNNRTRSTFSDVGTSEVVDVYHNYTTGGFTYVLLNGVCTAKVLNTKQQSDRCHHCTNAIYLGSNYYGAGDNTLNVDIYTSDFMSFPIIGSSDIQVIGSVTHVDDDVILPVTEHAVFLINESHKLTYSADFVSFKLEVDDADFAVPSVCDGKAITSVEELVTLLDATPHSDILFRIIYNLLD